jgi:hypothetical protein
MAPSQSNDTQCSPMLQSAVNIHDLAETQLQNQKSPIQIKVHVKPRCQRNRLIH